MTSLVEKLIGARPYPILTRIVSVPDYEVIKVVNDELTGNAITVTANLSCGTIRYVRLTLTVAIYADISFTPWTPPPNPGVQAVIPESSTSAHITDFSRQFAKVFQLYSDYVTVGSALKK